MIDYNLIYNLYNCKGLGRVKINNILTQLFVDSNKFKRDINILIEEFLISEFSDNYIQTDFKITDIEQKLNQKIHFIDFLSEQYPASLKLLLSNRPTILSCIGNLDLFEKIKIGFCGSSKSYR
ncbi:hypothetical protein [Chryseobacterium indoltheticum]|uniref:hypothetical protein n=1 Tax=Chryseobacterium indoltheticum TaxID=254 RepID=UPI003F496932